ncbi:Putative glutathione S-transferase domain superfamily [Colletotrichum destructivum]|uniref:Glutathione S-transferase domain superfamily n=1 Tax=Colletotrichum destructivum TaxID=34406 RepID=A0AAX4IAF0_9PEZI|nr:Putative glutathione S-transferase domain superfamily [Colletotrichum destructivum]
MSSTETVALYGHGKLRFGSGHLTDNRPKGYTPNPAKVAMILEELELPPVMVDLAVGPELGSSPSGSSAPLLKCLVETYNASGRVSHPSSPQQFLVKKRPCFQISRQVRSPPPPLLPFASGGSLLAPTFATAFVWGPYFGQLSWVKILHSEDVPSAKQRYEEQTVRILSVLYRALGGKQYLVRNRACV